MYVLSKNFLPIKESKLRLCPFCIALKNKSKKFKTEYALTWHITHEHKNDIGIIHPVIVNPHNTIEREILD